MKKLFALMLSALLMVTAVCTFGCKKEDGGKLGEVSLKYLNPPEIVQLLNSGDLDYGLIAEPMMTKLTATLNWEILDVQELYDSNTKGYPQAVLMVKNEVLESYPQLVREIENKFQENVEWAKSNISTAVNAVIQKYESTALKPANKLTTDAIDRCKIQWQSATDAKQSVNNYIDELLGIKLGLGITPASKVGEDFFYTTSSLEGQTIENKTFSFVVPDGAPALAIAKFINEEQNFISGATFNYSVVNAENIGGYMSGAIGSADFIIMPINSATLNHNDNYKMVSVITHGNLYLVSKTPFITGLVGKRVGVMGGEGKVPDLTLKIILKNNGLNYKTVK